MNTDNSPEAALAGVGVLVGGLLAFGASGIGAASVFALAAVGFAVLAMRGRLRRASPAPDAPPRGWERVLSAAALVACFLIPIRWFLVPLLFGFPAFPLWPPFWPP